MEVGALSRIEKSERSCDVMDHGDACEILATSQELDTLIVLYMKFQLSTRTECTCNFYYKLKNSATIQLSYILYIHFEFVL